jgi:DNA primase
MEITEYGNDRLPAGPNINDAEEVIVVEGRADVLNLLKHGIKNVIGMNGTSIPPTIIELSRKKILTLFVDGDRGGDLIIKELSSIAEIDYVIKAPDGKEVEEITKKEIHKALRSKVAIEQIKMEFINKPVDSLRKPLIRRDYVQPKSQNKPKIMNEDFKRMLDDLVGTRGAYILDTGSNILGKVPASELTSTIKELNDSNVYAIVFDGSITKDIVSIAEKSNIKVIVAMDSRVNSEETPLSIITSTDL